MITAADIITANVPSQALPPAPPQLREEFWCTPELRHIQRAAHSQGLPAAPVLMFGLGYIATATSYRVQLPPGPNYGSKNLTIVGAAASGGNKSSSMRCASRLFPLPQGVPCLCGNHAEPGEGDHIVVPVPSGQGMVKAFMSSFEVSGAGKNKTTVLRQDRRHVLVEIDEGTALIAAGTNKGATPLPTMAAMNSGSKVGWTNATSERKQQLDAESYRAVVMMAIQPAHAGPLFEEGDIGVAQKALWTPTQGRDIPDLEAGEEFPDDPGPLVIDPDLLRPIGDDPVIRPVDPAVRRVVQAGQNARARAVVQDVNPLDAHADFNRLRIASILAEIHNTDRVTEQWWELAGMVMDDLHFPTRDGVQAAIAKKNRERNAAGGVADAERRRAADNVHHDAIDAAAKALHRGVARHADPDVQQSNQTHQSGDPCTSRCVAHHLRNHRGIDREAVVDRAVQLSWLEPSGAGWLPGLSEPA